MVLPTCVRSAACAALWALTASSQAGAAATLAEPIPGAPAGPAAIPTARPAPTAPVVVATPAAATAGDPNGSTPLDPSSPDVAKLGAATADFGPRVLAELLTSGDWRGRTTLISPLSLVAALSMLAQGARGDAALSFASGLGFDEANLLLQRSGGAYAALARGMPEGDGVTARLAAGLWASKDAGLIPAFVTAEKTQFSAQVAEVDFTSPQTLPAINGYVAKATNGKIPQVLDQLPADSQIVLANALYFKGAWLDRFDRAQTKASPFRRADGTVVDSALMHRSGAFNYAETAEFQAVALPYKDERFELIVALPTGRDLRPDWYGAVQAAAFSWRPGEVDLPRLQLKASEEMLPALKAAGLSKALSGGADYSGLSAKPPRIDSVAHSAVLVVDEEGAEGAAATAIVGVRSAVVLAPFKFRADRPFELALRDRLSGALLFLGHVSEPGVGP